jgi:hypothetical protein
MAKKQYHNMNPKERMAYWEKLREKEKSERAVKINKLSLEQRMAIVEVHKLLDDILDTALYPDMGGIKMVSAYSLQELSDARDTLQFQFNLGENK